MRVMQQPAGATKWCLCSVFKMSFSKILKRLTYFALHDPRAVASMSKREWSTRDQIQRHGDEASICSYSDGTLCFIGDHGVCRLIDDRGIDRDSINEEQHKVDVSGANTMHVCSCMHHSLLFLAMD
jgi:hypothetical protein